MSVLRVMHAVLADPSLRSRPQFTELVTFCKGVVRNVLTKIAPEKYEKGDDADMAQQAKHAGLTVTADGQQEVIDLVDGMDVSRKGDESAGIAEGKGDNDDEEEEEDLDEEEVERKEKKEKMKKRMAECEHKVCMLFFDIIFCLFSYMNEGRISDR